jgi:Uma2 family endonuclease
MQTLDPADPPVIVYPDQDGKPMSDNTKQGRWIVLLYANLEALFLNRDDVFVAADNLWYPVEGRPDIRQAPDVYVVFGRPKGDRGSYKQWEEGGVPIHVVFEILSPGNDLREMAQKHLFYEDHGVEEYYIYDPDDDYLTIWVRGPMGAALRRADPRTFTSPRMGIRFDTSGEELVVRYPDGRPFRTLAEIAAERDRVAAERDQVAAERDQATAERDEARRRLDRMVGLTQKALTGTATEEERAELQSLMTGS